jgi:hypothetical protein
LRVSREKVENVVKAPMNPTPRKLLRRGSISVFSERIDRNPMRKQPVMLTAKVPHGKMPAVERKPALETVRETMYRETAPRAPPAAIESRLCT